MSPDRSPPISFTDFRASRRELLLELATASAEILARSPRPLRARDIASRLTSQRGVTVSPQQLMYALRRHDDILVWHQLRGHEARWAHRCWLPTLESLYPRPRSCDATGVA